MYERLWNPSLWEPTWRFSILIHPKWSSTGSGCNLVTSWWWPMGPSCKFLMGNVFIPNCWKRQVGMVGTLKNYCSSTIYIYIDMYRYFIILYYNMHIYIYIYIHITIDYWFTHVIDGELAIERPFSADAAAALDGSYRNLRYPDPCGHYLSRGEVLVISTSAANLWRNLWDKRHEDWPGATTDQWDIPPSCTQST